MQLEVGAKGPETNFVTGAFVLDDPLARQILAVLPPVIRMRPEVEQGVPSFLENIQFITREVETDRPGSEVVLLRMADVIFIQILRAYLARVPDDGGGFLGALRDPRTAAALGAMHHRAEAPWTVASLAKEVGLSRSVFASRFTQLVGEPPLGYLTRLRMQKAAILLREGARRARGTGAPGAWPQRLPARRGLALDQLDQLDAHASPAGGRGREVRRVDGRRIIGPIASDARSLALV